MTERKESALTIIPSAAAIVAEGIRSDWHAALARQVAARELSANTASIYKTGLRKLMTFAHARAQDAGRGIDADTIRDWKAQLLGAGRASGSVNTWLAGVKHFYAWARETGRAQTDPTKDIKSAKRSNTTKRHKRDALTDTEVVRLLDLSMPARERALIALKAYCGVRDVELQRADVGDIRTESGELVIAVQGKGRIEKDEIAVIAHPDAKRALYDWLAERGADPGPLFTSQSDRNRNGRMSMSAIRTIVKDAYGRAGIVGERKTSHSLRHTAITNILRNGGSLQQAQAVARHANIATTGVYVHELNRIANAGEKLIEYRR